MSKALREIIKKITRNKPVVLTGADQVRKIYSRIWNGERKSKVVKLNISTKDRKDDYLLLFRDDEFDCNPY